MRVPLHCRRSLHNSRYSFTPTRTAEHSALLLKNRQGYHPPRLPVLADSPVATRVAVLPQAPAPSLPGSDPSHLLVAASAWAFSSVWPAPPMVAARSARAAPP